MALTQEQRSALIQEAIRRENAGLPSVREEIQQKLEQSRAEKAKQQEPPPKNPSHSE